jgi:hypothetical protein
MAPSTPSPWALKIEKAKQKEAERLRQVSLQAASSKDPTNLNQASTTSAATTPAPPEPKPVVTLERKTNPEGDEGKMQRMEELRSKVRALAAKIEEEIKEREEIKDSVLAYQGCAEALAYVFNWNGEGARSDVELREGMKEMQEALDRLQGGKNNE